MASRITIYGKKGDKATELLKRELRSMSLDYNFADANDKSCVEKLVEDAGNGVVLPVVQVACAHAPGSVYLTNPDILTFRQTLYNEEILGITSYWI